MGIVYKGNHGNSQIALERKRISKEEALEIWPDQPERSKREDLHCDCKRKMIFDEDPLEKGKMISPRFEHNVGCGALNTMET